MLIILIDHSIADLTRLIVVVILDFTVQLFRHLIAHLIMIINPFPYLFWPVLLLLELPYPSFPISLA